MAVTNRVKTRSVGSYFRQEQRGSNLHSLANKSLAQYERKRPTSFDFHQTDFILGSVFIFSEKSRLTMQLWVHILLLN